MRTLPTLPAACLLLLCGCASPHRLQEGSGATHLGAPIAPVDPGLLGTPASAPETPAVRLPDRITLPATYRLMLLDGHLALVREADPQVLDQAPASLRIVAGEIARGELAYQPGLLPQELAAALAANRESTARMDHALDAVMRRSRELAEQALELQAQSRQLAGLVSSERSRGPEPELPSRPPAPKPPAPDAGPPPPQD